MMTKCDFILTYRWNQSAVGIISIQLPIRRSGLVAKSSSCCCQSKHGFASGAALTRRRTREDFDSPADGGDVVAAVVVVADAGDGGVGVGETVVARGVVRSCEGRRVEVTNGVEG